MTTTAKRPLTAKQAAFQFFLKNGACSYNPAMETKQQGYARQARRLAKAEREARELGYTFLWEMDQDGCTGCDCGSQECDCATGADHECLICIMNDPEGNAVQSLGSVCKPSREYGRVIEADLALEQLG